MKIIIINNNSIDYIYKFLNQPIEISDHFRYFQSRDPNNILSQHVYTIVGFDEETNNVIAYGHIDFEEKYWLGICIWNSYCGKGYGTQIMNNLINYADMNKINLSLSVDLTNTHAIRMYEKYNFKRVRATEHVLYMNRPILIN